MERAHLVFFKYLDFDPPEYPSILFTYRTLTTCEETFLEDTKKQGFFAGLDTV
jgi:hypothetical protein